MKMAKMTKTMVNLQILLYNFLELSLRLLSLSMILLACLDRYFGPLFRHNIVGVSHPQSCEFVNQPR